MTFPSSKHFEGKCVLLAKRAQFTSGQAGATVALAVIMRLERD